MAEGARVIIAAFLQAYPMSSLATYYMLHITDGVGTVKLEDVGAQCQTFSAGMSHH